MSQTKQTHSVKKRISLSLSLYNLHSRKYHKSNMLTPCLISMAYFSRLSRDKLSTNKRNYAHLAGMRLMLLMNRCNDVNSERFFFTLGYAMLMYKTFLRKNSFRSRLKNAKNVKRTLTLNVSN